MLEEVLIVGLAAWRLAHMLTEEDGPANVFRRLRSFFGVPIRGEVPDGFLPTVFSCVYCMSFYTTALAFGAYELLGAITVIPFAAWGLGLIAGERLR